MAVSVPHAPGVPPVIFVPGAGEVVSLLTQDAISLFAGAVNAPWGIYLVAVPVILADNVVSFEYQQQYNISNYPVEGGAFASYNKVYQPFDVIFRFTAGGDLLNRQKLIDSIEAVIGDLNQYNVVTADATYVGVNIVGWRYAQKSDDGLGLLKIDVMAKQVKNAPSISRLINSPLVPGVASQVINGVRQAVNAVTSQLGFLPQILASG